MPETAEEHVSKRSWEFEVRDSKTLTFLSYVFPSVLGGVGLLVVLFFGRLLLDSLLAGDVGRAVFYLVFGVLAALIPRWFIPAVFETNLYEPLRTQFTKSGVLLGSVCGALVMYASLRLHPFAPFIVFIGSWIPLVAVAGFPITGCVELSEKSFIVKGTEIPLRSVRRYRTFSAGPLVCCWLSYARGVPRAPRAVIVPREDFAVVQRLMEDVVGHPARRGSTIGRPQRWILTVFGVAQLAIGPALWFLLPDGGKLVAGYAGATFGVTGVVMLWYAKTA